MAKETQIRVNFKGVDRTASAIKGVESRIAGMSRRIGGLLVGAFAVRGLMGFGGESVRLFQAQEAAAKKLKAVITATGGASGRTFMEMQAMAKSLQGMTNYSDEVVMNGQAILATFKNISGVQFDRATRSVLDLAAVLETDVKSAAIQLGKALNDPAVGLTYLNRAGITFSATQQNIIKNLAKQGELSKAQSIILAEVESQFGGAAVAMADPLKQLANSWGDVREQIGGAIFELAQFSGVFSNVEGGIAGVGSKLEGVSLSIFSMMQGLKSFTKIALVGFEIVADAAGRLSVGLETLDFKSAFEGFEGVGDRITRIFKEQEKAIESFAKKKGDADIIRQLAVVASKADEASGSILRLKGLMGKMVLAGTAGAIQAQFGGVEAKPFGFGQPMQEVAGVRGKDITVVFNQMLNQMKEVARNTQGLDDIEGTI